MRNLSLDVDALAVDSFATAGNLTEWEIAESTGCMTYFAAGDNGTQADTFVSCVAVKALTEAYPCKTTR